MPRYGLEGSFPDYKREWLPSPMPEGFEDTSWWNDACPSFSNERLTIYMDYPDDNMREEQCQGIPRFTLRDHTVDTSFNTDSWDEMLAKVEEYRKRPLT